MKEIKVPFDNLLHICHVGDIHIRNLKRHNEYKTVFKRLYNDIKSKNLKNSLIYLAGDIVHSKLDMSPELVSMTYNFLKSLSNLAPTLLICGNHDAALRNKSRMDVLTPIVDALRHPNLHYLRNSGVYTVADTSFVVMSVFDEPASYLTSDDVGAETKVALFHGPIDNSTTDVGFVITNRAMPLSKFDGFDVVMLGDIHKAQTLQSYNKAEKKPVVRFCGSLIQQNHGESVKNHGYTLWHMPTRTYEHVEIPNDYGYYTLDVVNGAVPDVFDMPKRPRLRVRVSNTASSDLNRIMTEVRKKYKVQEFTLIRSDTLLYKQRKDRSSIILGDVTNVDLQNQLIEDHLQSKYALSTEMLDEITS
jgi:DNA repair exonuclease SbcCD nuclease subunit